MYALLQQNLKSISIHHLKAHFKGKFTHNNFNEMSEKRF